MTNAQVIESLGMNDAKPYKLKRDTINSNASRYRGLYWVIKQITSQFEYTVKKDLQYCERNKWYTYCITITYDNGRGSAYFELPNHYATNSHLNAFNSAIIAMLQSGKGKSISLPSKAAASW